MIIKKLDFLSPPLTFYYKGSLSHTSIISGIISIISIILILVLSIQIFWAVVKKRDPKSYSFVRFEKEAGIYPFNSSSLFHFVSLAHNQSSSIDFEDAGVDFRSFRVIGLNSYAHLYLDQGRNLSKFDHYIYGFCNYKSDANEIGNILIDNKFFEHSACIRKFFNASEQKYYETGDPKFKWPRLSHGTFNKNHEHYSIILEKCEEETLKLILGENSHTHCKTDEEINELVSFNSIVHLYYVDHYIDPLNYKNPTTKFINQIENSVSAKNYPVNHLNFNPTSVKTHSGLIFDNIHLDNSYIYERNDVFTYSKPNIYTIYYFWLKNNMHYHERNYKRLPDVISDIGGISQFINIIAFFINNFYNKYIILFDTKNLLLSLIDSEKKQKKENDRKIKSKIFNFEEKILNKNKKDLSIQSQIPNEDNKYNLTKLKSDKSISKSFNNFIGNKNSFASNKKHKKHKIGKETKIDSNISNVKNATNDLNSEKNKTFFDFVIFIFSCHKKKTSFKFYNTFREKIFSEEHLIKSHLIIYNLNKSSERKKKSRRNSYQLKDLIKLV